MKYTRIRTNSSIFISSSNILSNSCVHKQKSKSNKARSNIRRHEIIFNRATSDINYSATPGTGYQFCRSTPLHSFTLVLVLRYKWIRSARRQRRAFGKDADRWKPGRRDHCLVSISEAARFKVEADQMRGWKDVGIKAAPRDGGLIGSTQGGGTTIKRAN